jgi:hypothetical protein
METSEELLAGGRAFLRAACGLLRRPWDSRPGAALPPPGDCAELYNARRSDATGPIRRNTAAATDSTR